MAIQVQYRRGTTSENNAFTGALAEITVDTTTNTLRVHDGVTAGGFPVAGTTTTQTLTNKTLSAPTFTGALTGNLVPSADNTYTLGNATSSWSALYVAGNTIYLGNLQLKESSANTFAVFTSDGTTEANLVVGNIDVSALTQGTSTIGLADLNGNAYITVAGTANVLVVSNTGANVTGTLTASGNANVGNLGTAGVVTATGNITGGNLRTASVVIGNGPISGITTISASGNANVGNIGAAAAIFTGTASVTGNITGGNITTAGQVTATGNITGGNITTAGQVTATGNVSGGNLNVTGNIVDTGPMSLVTGASGNINIAPNSTNVLVITTTGANVTGTLNASGNANVGNLGATNANVTAITATGNANVGNLGTSGLITATGNITGGNIITAGNISAGNLKVTGIEAVTTLTVSGDTLISGNLTVNGSTITANVTSLVVTDPILGLGRGANGAPLISNDGLDRGVEMFYYTTAEQIAFMGYDNSAAKMISAANVSVSNNLVTVNSYGTTVVGTLESTVVTATGNITGGNLKTDSVVIGNGPISGVTTISASGNANVGNLGTAGLITATGNITGGNLRTSSVVISGTAISGATTISATGNVSGGNITTAGQVTATGNVSGNFFIGNGSQLSGIDATSIQSGTSNVRVVSSGGNVTVGIAGTSNVVVINNATTTISGNMVANMVFTANTIPSGANINQVGYNGLMAGPLLISDGANFTVTTSITII
jgi:hypothetical protein